MIDQKGKIGTQFSDFLEEDPSFREDGHIGFSEQGLRLMYGPASQGPNIDINVKGFSITTERVHFNDMLTHHQNVTDKIVNLDAYQGYSEQVRIATRGLLWLALDVPFEDLLDHIKERYGGLNYSRHEDAQAFSDVGIILDFKDQNPTKSLHFGPVKASEGKTHFKNTGMEHLQFSDVGLFVDCEFQRRNVPFGEVPGAVTEQWENLQKFVGEFMKFLVDQRFDW